MKYLPDYNPVLMGGSDIENIEECFKQLKEQDDYAYKQINELMSKVTLQKEENEELKEEIIELKEKYEGELITQEEFMDQKLKEEEECDFCSNKKCHLVKRDAGYDEWTCDKCYKEQYPEEE